MGEAPPYTAEDLDLLLAGATFVGVKEWDQDRRDQSITFLLEKDGRPIELEIDSCADWDGCNDWTESASITSEITVYVRGVDAGG